MKQKSQFPLGPVIKCLLASPKSGTPIKYSCHTKHGIYHFHIDLRIISLQPITVRQLTQINGWTAVFTGSIVPPAKKGAAVTKRTVSILTGASILQVSTVIVSWCLCWVVCSVFFYNKT